MTRNLMFIAACVPLFITLSFSNAQDRDTAVVPAALTTPGTQWLIHVRQYSMGWAIALSNPEKVKEAQRPKIQREFHIAVTILEPRGEGENRVARIQFRTRDDDLPDHAKGTVVLEIDANTGAPRAVKEIAGSVGGNTSIAEFDGERVFFANSAFPMSWIVRPTDLARIPAREEEHRVAIETRSSLGPTGHFLQFMRKLRPTVTEPDKQRAVEIESFSLEPLAELPYHRVVQTWVPGEGWWRSYTRYIQGHIDLEATLVEHEEK